MSSTISTSMPVMSTDRSFTRFTTPLVLVDAPFRDMAPLLCQGSEVLMVFGVGASEALRLDDRRENILLRMEGELPWAGENNGGNDG